MRTKGWTLVEVLTALGIIALVATLAYPVIAGARQSAASATCISQLKQIHVAISVYRTAYDGDAVYGESSAMGLPPNLMHLAKEQSLPHALFECKGRKTIRIAPLYHLMYAPEGTVGRPSWAEYVKDREESAVILGDYNHDFDTIPRHSNFVRHRGIGMYLDGSVRTVVKAGDWFSNTWW